MFQHLLHRQTHLLLSLSLSLSLLYCSQGYVVMETCVHFQHENHKLTRWDVVWNYYQCVFVWFQTYLVKYSPSFEDIYQWVSQKTIMVRHESTQKQNIQHKHEMFSQLWDQTWKELYSSFLDMLFLIHDSLTPTSIRGWPVWVAQGVCFPLAVPCVLRQRKLWFS